MKKLLVSGCALIGALAVSQSVFSNVFSSLFSSEAVAAAPADTQNNQATHETNTPKKVHAQAKKVKKTEKATPQKVMHKKVATQSTAQMRAQLEALQKQVDAMAEHHKNEGVHTQFGDRIALSGGINAQISTSSYGSPSGFSGPATTAMNLNTAYLNFNALLFPWLRSYLALSYEPGGVSTTTGGSFTAPEVEEAYIQMAQPKSSPFFFSLGKEYMPFAVYNRYPVVNSLTQSLSETNKVGAVLGVNESPFFGSVYVFDQQGSNNGFGTTTDSQLANGGAEVGVVKVSDVFGYEASLGYLNNMAETRFIYGVIKSTNQVVGAMAGHLSFNIHRFGFIGNFVHALRRFSAQDITYNGSGAEPSAYEAEINYTIPVNGRPLIPALGYEHSSESLFLGLANYRYVLSMEYPINKYLSTTVEYLRSKDYSANSVGTYATGVSTAATITGTGSWSNAGVVSLAANF